MCECCVVWCENGCVHTPNTHSHTNMTRTQTHTRATYCARFVNSIYASIKTYKFPLKSFTPSTIERLQVLRLVASTRNCDQNAHFVPRSIRVRPNENMLSDNSTHACTHAFVCSLFQRTSRVLLHISGLTTKPRIKERAPLLFWWSPTSSSSSLTATAAAPARIQDF